MYQTAGGLLRKMHVAGSVYALSGRYATWACSTIVTPTKTCRPVPAATAAVAVCADGMWLDMSEAANFCTGSVCEVPRDNKTAVWGEWTC